jgi:hypothetical protein
MSDDRNETNNRERKSDGCKPSVLSDLLATRLKNEVSRIILSALSGSDRNLRTGDNYIKWGLVERRIHEAIDKECG